MAGPICPNCGESNKSKVLETRQFDDVVKRRRRCINCDNVFITSEISGDIVVKNKDIDIDVDTLVGRLGNMEILLQNILFSIGQFEQRERDRKDDSRERNRWSR